MAQGEQNLTGFEATLKHHAQQLVDSLEQGRFGDAVELIHRLNQARDYGLYQEVGKLTRELHSAIVRLELESGPGDQAPTSQVADATTRLSYVVDMTEKAANKTMDLVEASAPLVNYISYEAQSLTAEWQRFRHRELTAEEFRELARRIDQFFLRSMESSDQLSGNLQEILIAQDFQDLTGQTIKRVTQLLGDLEKNLLELVVTASKVDQFAGIQHDREVLRAEHQEKRKQSLAHGEGPQMTADNQDDVVKGQDDVDDLLSSLGF